nr:putative ribonuclease H-like domain-containing protein [Tanacetum cinerariifolium]
MSAKDRSRLGYGSQIHDGVLTYENEVFASVFDSRSSDVKDSHVNDIFEKVERMHAVPPPMTGNYMPVKSSFGIDDEETLETMPKPVESKPKVVNEPKVWSDAPIIKEYDSDSDDEHVTIPLKEQEKPSFAFVNTVEHNTVPSGCLACLIAKATVDESTKWHRRSKGIKREYSTAKTPQQNGVAKRKNRTLIEAARTVLADLFLPNTFWAEAVSTACYVLNRVLVTKPQTKTPYELLTDKTVKSTDFKTCEKPVSQVEQIFLGELKKLKRQEKEATDVARNEATHDIQNANTNSTNLLNTVSTPLSVAGP